MPGTLQQREQAERELRAMNRKDVYELPDELKIAGQPIFIFNISPFKFQRSMGSYGQWTIHPCPEGEMYSKPTEVPYITNDPIHVDMFQMAHRHDSGRKLAADILGVGQFHAPDEDLTRWGVFIAAGEKPTSDELKAARKKLNRTMDMLIQEADQYWNQGPQAYVNITDMHRLAAKERHQITKPWARAVVEMTVCHICGSQLNPEAAICPICKTVIDEARVIEAKVPGYEHLWKKSKKGDQENA